MSADPSPPEDEPKRASSEPVARRRMDFLLLALTALGVLVYWPVLKLLPRVVRASHPAGMIMLTPLAFMFVAVCAASWWCWRGATRRSRLVWAIFVTLGLMGWPSSCVYSLLTANHGVPMPH